MKVLVWTSYGDTKVYSFSNGFADKLKQEVLNLVNGIYDNYSVASLEDRTSLSGIMEWVNVYTDDDENFNQFEIVELEEL